jgi:acetylornithine deacetylase/succinyl-diaminopimelate desuccinylase-like protein
LHLNFDATNFLADLTDETGALTQNLGIIDLKDGAQKIGINYRVPAFSELEKDLIEPMKVQAQKYDFTVAVQKLDDRVYVPKDSPLIQKMMQAYQTVTGDLKSEPLAIGGGTYAKSMPNVE